MTNFFLPVNLTIHFNLLFSRIFIKNAWNSKYEAYFIELIFIVVKFNRKEV